MQLQVLQESIFDSKADVLVLPVIKGAKNLPLKELDSYFNGELERLIARQKFEGEVGSSFSIPALGHLKAGSVLLIGLGERSEFSLDTYRRFGALAVKRARESKAQRVAIGWSQLPASEIGNREQAQAFAEGALLAGYQFQTYRGRVKPKREAIETITCLVEGSATVAAAVERGLLEGRTLAEATILARDLVNTPSGDMTPLKLAEAAKSVAGRNIKIKILDKREMTKLGMGGALGVAQGSIHEPVGVHLIYKPSNSKSKNKSLKIKRVAIVGKAVTFDSGGLSIKPADGMMTMKIDMGGAATTIGLFKALSALDLQVEVHGIFLAVENMPSGSAYRPGDVLKIMNGMTVEVLNTDAEGRITLADALAYAVKQKPDAIIDLATLTGACVTALGEEVAGLFANDRRLADRLLEAARQAGEDVWELPLHKPYKELIKSKIADLKNVGPRGGSAITAALFLEPFTGGVPWAHIDIAGPVYTEKETRPDMPYGGTGFGVRLLARYLQGL